MTEIKDVHQAIINVMHDVGYVQKERAKNLTYSFAGEAALIAALRPSMIENGLYCYVVGLPQITRESYQTAKGTSMTSTLTHGVVRFIHAPSGTSIDVMATGEGADAGDKSANKAATGLLKYALRQTFLIETGDDPDKEPSEPHGPPLAKTGQMPAVGPPRSTPADARLPNQWESDVIEKLIEAGFADSREHVVGILNYSPFVDIPYQTLELFDAAVYVVGWTKVREEYPKTKAEDRAQMVNDLYRDAPPAWVEAAEKLLGMRQ